MSRPRLETDTFLIKVTSVTIVANFVDDGRDDDMVMQTTQVVITGVCEVGHCIIRKPYIIIIIYVLSPVFACNLYLTL
jgi:hypothetical protein